MRSVPDRSGAHDRGTVLRELTERIRATERRRFDALRTGWSSGWSSGGSASADADLGADLCFGAVHEWLGLAGEAAAADPRRLAGEWAPPITVLVHLARSRGGVWIGRRVWPAPHALGAAAAGRAVLLDAATDAERVWAIDAALRVPGLIVVADGSRLDMASTRRLQLAAESSGAIGLLARPAHERGEISAAWTRWVVGRVRSPTDRPRWSVELVRSKSSGAGMRAMRHGPAIVELGDDGSLVDVSADVAVRPGEACGAAAAGGARAAHAC